MFPFSRVQVVSSRPVSGGSFPMSNRMSSILFCTWQLSTFICGATFLACSVYGWFTRRDLTSMGNFMFMGLIGIIIASLANLFFKSSGLQAIISYIGVLVFVGLTAYDTQKIKNMALSQPAGLEAGVVRKGAIMGALSLYLDFINLFIMLLHIFGGNRE